MPGTAALLCLTSHWAGRRMKDRLEPVAESRNRSWGREHIDDRTPRSFEGKSPSIELESPQALVDHQRGLTVAKEDYRAGREVIDGGGPWPSIGGAHQAPPAVEPLYLQPAVDFRCQEGDSSGRGRHDGIAIRDIGVTAAESAGTMSGCESDRIVEKEQWSPPANHSKRLSP